MLYITNHQKSHISIYIDRSGHVFPQAVVYTFSQLPCQEMMESYYFLTKTLGCRE